MDQAYRLRNLVGRQNKVLYILSGSNYKYASILCKQIALVLDNNGFKVNHINAREQEKTSGESASDINIVQADSWEYIKNFGECDSDVILVTDTTPEVILNTYLQIKLMIINSVYLPTVERKIMLTIGPVDDIEEAYRIQCNFTRALNEYLNIKVDYLGCFTDIGKDTTDIITRYLDLRYTNGKNK